MVGGRHWRSERTLPGKLCAAPGVRLAWTVKTKLGRGAEVCLCSLDEAMMWRQFVLRSRTAGGFCPPGETKTLPTYLKIITHDVSLVYPPLETRFYFVVVIDRFLGSGSLYDKTPLKNWKARKKRSEPCLQRVSYWFCWSAVEYFRLIVLWPKSVTPNSWVWLLFFQTRHCFVILCFMVCVSVRVTMKLTNVFYIWPRHWWFLSWRSGTHPAWSCFPVKRFKTLSLCWSCL